MTNAMTIPLSTFRTHSDPDDRLRKDNAVVCRRRACSRAMSTMPLAALRVAAAVGMIVAAAAYADTDGPPTVTAKDVQNPVASLVTVPVQDNSYFDVGPYKKTEDVVLMEPVVPFRLGDNWNLITRWITPLMYQPSISPVHGSTYGLGNIEPELFISPSHPGPIIWAVGPTLWLPTATDKSIGVNKWGGGPGVAALTIQGPWLFGVIANQVWAGHTRADAQPINAFPGDHVNQATINPIVFYNFPKGWYLLSSTVSVAQWDAPGRDVWTVPVGGGLGRLFRIGTQPVNVRFQAMDNVHRPEYAPKWQFQLQGQLLFPVSR